MFLMVGDRDVWDGYVSGVQHAWARWCVLQVLPPNASDKVVNWLKTGDLTEGSFLKIYYKISHDIFSEYYCAEQAFLCVLNAGTIHDFVTDVCNAARFAVRAATRNSGPSPLWDVAKEAQSAHLRTLLLRRASGKARWSLIDGHPGVLCDALLDRT